MPHPSWNESYASGELPWDTGQPEPLLVEFVTSSGVAPTQTLEIGAGTGTNAFWLAEAMGMLLCRHITPEQARAVASLCREMRQNLPRFEWEMKQYQLVSGAEPGEARGPYLP